MPNKIDHFAIGAADLSQGQTLLEQVAGVMVPRGSKHDAMSTHNCVCQGGAESFLEIIAIDPEAPDPGRTRWFTLDDPQTQARLLERPQALCWVVGTDALDSIVSRSPVDLGEVVFFQRGERTWRLTVPKDGSLPEGGLLPAFIEWSPGPHPSSGMQDLGIELTSVDLRHPDPAYLSDLFAVLEIGHLARIRHGERSLSFALNTPNGPVTIG